MLSFETTGRVESPAEDTAKVAKLKRRCELYASVTPDAIPSLVAEPASDERCSCPSANLNT
jgi:hypothetical protein